MILFDQPCQTHELIWSSTMQARMQPEDLTNQMINDIGKNYLADYPKATWRHRSQEAAQKVAGYAEDVDSRYKWLELATLHFDLCCQSKKGELTTKIEKLFESAFSLLKRSTMGLTVYNHDAIFGRATNYYHNMVKAHFDNQSYDATRTMQNKNAANTQLAASHLLSRSSPLRTASTAYPSIDKVDEPVITSRSRFI
jgi:hypothetical protein